MVSNRRWDGTAGYGDWLIDQEHCEASVPAILAGLAQWPAGAEAAERKLKLFNERLIGLALDRLAA